MISDAEDGGKSDYCRTAQTSDQLALERMRWLEGRESADQFGGAAVSCREPPSVSDCSDYPADMFAASLHGLLAVADRRSRFGATTIDGPWNRP